MIGADPVDLPVLHGLPQILDVLARADRRIDLRKRSRGRIVVKAEVADRHFTPEIEVRKRLSHLQRRIDSLARRQMQEVDVETVRLVREVTCNENCQTLGMRRPSRTVRAQALELAFPLDDLRVGVRSEEHTSELQSQSNL